MDSHRPGVTSFVHVGLVVEDLDETVRFFALLGFDCGEPGVFSGEWIDRIIGLENVTVEVVMARAPTAATCSRWCASTRLPPTLRSRRRPRTVLGSDTSPSRSTTCGGVVDRVREAGWETVGEIVDYENTFLLCYVRGPEGLIVELAERLDGAPG